VQISHVARFSPKLGRDGEKAMPWQSFRMNFAYRPSSIEISSGSRVSPE
jgi:hypothetical protein